MFVYVTQHPSWGWAFDSRRQGVSDPLRLRLPPPRGSGSSIPDPRGVGPCFLRRCEPGPPALVSTQAGPTGQLPWAGGGCHVGIPPPWALWLASQSPHGPRDRPSMGEFVSAGGLAIERPVPRRWALRGPAPPLQVAAPLRGAAYCAKDRHPLWGRAIRCCSTLVGLHSDTRRSTPARVLLGISPQHPRGVCGT